MSAGCRPLRNASAAAARAFIIILIITAAREITSGSTPARLPKIWDQMSLAKQYGADRIWIVNVGHFKGYELPLEYFMNLAWDPKRWTNTNMDEFTRLWAAREFGPEYAGDIADIHFQIHQIQRPPQTGDARARHLQPGELSGGGNRGGGFQRHHAKARSDLSKAARRPARCVLRTGVVSHQGQRARE